MPLLDQPKSWRTFSRRLRHRLKLECYWRLFPHRSYQPLFVLATGRSGSTMLTDLLRGLSGVDCGGEVLHHQLPTGVSEHERSPARALLHIRKSLQMLRSPIRGCKLMMYQMQMCRMGVEQLAEAFADAKYIILYRESMAEQFVSHHCARVTNQWVLRSDQVRAQARIEVDPEELKKFCNCTRGNYEQLLSNAWLRERSLLVSYEELVAERQTWFRDRICPFLGVPAREPTTRLLKQSVNKLADRVANFDEVSALLNSPLCRQRHAWPGDARRRAA